jgi:hypothetical protein
LKGGVARLVGGGKSQKPQAIVHDWPPGAVGEVESELGGG